MYRDVLQRSFWPRCLLTLLFVISCALAAGAQTLFQGRIDLTLRDAQGSSIPGVLVEIDGPAVQQQTTDSNGEAHFLNLPPGTYNVKATLQGFRPYANERVPVTAGTSVPLRITMQVAGVTESVQVMAEASPLVDPARQTLTTSVEISKSSSKSHRRAIRGSYCRRCLA
jgi:hypothetical protein